MPLLSLERLKIFERFALGESVNWISLADGEKEEVGGLQGEGEKINHAFVCVCVVYVCVHVCISVRFSSSF